MASLPDDLKEIYAQLKRQECELSREINEMMLQVELSDEHQMEELKQRQPDPQILLADLIQMERTIKYNSEVSERVTGNLRKLDIVKGRVSECLHRISDISDLKTCTASIQTALDNEEYENAALIVQRFLKIDESEVRRSISISENQEDDKKEDTTVMTASSMDDAFRRLHDSKKKLQAMVLEKFDTAVSENDVASVERFFKLFPFLNQEKEGLRKFSNYLSSKISNESMAVMSAPNTTHPEQLGALFQIIAKTIDVHQPLVETYYKHGNLLVVVEVLQKECDRRCKKVIEDFKAKRGFSQIIQVMNKSMAKSSWTSTAPVMKVDTRELDKMLTEMILVTSRCETYLKFLRNRVYEDNCIAYPEEQSKEFLYASQRLETFIRNCELSRQMQDLDGNYVLMEEYFMRESVTKAIELDEEQSNEYLSGTNEGPQSSDIGNNLTSHIIDDVFFILKKCIRRSNSGGNIDVVCAIINHCITILDTLYYDALNERVRYGFPNSITNAAASLDLSQAYNALQAGRYLQSSADIEKTKKLFLIGVNDLLNSCDYIKTLKKMVREEVSKNWVAGQLGPSSSATLVAKQSAILDSCLSDLTSSTSKFQQLVHESLKQINATILKPLTKSWVESFTSLEDTPIEDEDSSALYPFTRSFIVNTESIFKSLKLQLLEPNYQSLVSIFANDVATRFEIVVFKFYYDKLSAFRLDRDVRAVVSYVTGLSDVSIRETFARLKQITFIINMDSVQEALDTFGPNADDDFKLPASDLRGILKLRNDFNRTEIRRIKY